VLQARRRDHAPAVRPHDDYSGKIDTARGPRSSQAFPPMSVKRSCWPTDLDVVPRGHVSAVGRTISPRSPQDIEGDGLLDGRRAPPADPGQGRLIVKHTTKTVKAIVP